ncbi:MAG: triose-phosphate isomerase [Candidatus Rokubacteria bacterium]|nr:triose-phosphate isomerase [Candidatus Rokubacteria bacterium]
MRAPLVVANWKMHGTIAEGRALASAVRDGLKRPRGVEVVLCPPFTVLPAVAEVLAGSAIAVGAQNCYWETSGAFTGEVSPAMLAELGCRLVIVGHSERRQHLGETDAQVNLKVRAALAHGLAPLLCVGESADERRQGLTFNIVEGELRAGLRGLSPEALGHCIVAYEPVWAIGTGVNATPAQASEVHGYLRGLLSELASKEIAQTVRILYGGSVKPDNAGELCREPEIDGGLVGGASLQAQAFVGIVKKAAGRGATPKE